MKTKTIIFLFTILLCLSCGKKETEILGEVFVVTKGAGNYKFGLVQVAVLPLEQAKEHLKKQQSEIEKAWQESIKFKSDCDEYEKQSPESERSARMEQLLQKCQDEAENGKEEVYALYFKGLPQPLISAVTDSDGKYSLKIPEKGKYAVMATASRSVTGSRTEKYFWMVETEAKGEPQKLTLSNNNMVASNDSSSLIKAGG